LSAAESILATQMELYSNLEMLKKAFSTNGLLAYKIENLVKELEELVNSYLGELSDGRFTLEFVVSNDKLNVQVTDNGNIIDILALSSGELARVNTATLIAIRKLMSSISKSKLNILFLDEVTNVLDDSGREKLVEVLLGEEELNTYVVSHGWTHPLLEKIEIAKKGSISVLEK
jgi:DNA repair exonuclease SbcCD ATPase subunit